MGYWPIRSAVGDGLYNFGCVSTKNDRYVILLGGYGNDQSIYIYDVKHNVFKKSKIKCQQRGEFNALITNDMDRNNLLTFGYINNCYKLDNFSNVQLLPLYLIKIVAKYAFNQQIYLMSIHNGSRFKFNVDHILNNME